MYSINVNDRVKVKLSETGLAIARARDFAKTAEAVDNEGYSSWRLWILMDVFGAYLWCVGCGGPILFEQNEIRIDERSA